MGATRQQPAFSLLVTPGAGADKGKGSALKLTYRDAGGFIWSDYVLTNVKNKEARISDHYPLWGRIFADQGMSGRSIFSGPTECGNVLEVATKVLFARPTVLLQAPWAARAPRAARASRPGQLP
jgi:hypothetical protein